MAWGFPCWFASPPWTRACWAEMKACRLNATVTTIGLIGAGKIGSQLARLAVANGYNVVISNSRGPDSLSALVAELGPRARAATALEAAKAGDIVVVTIPL